MLVPEKLLHYIWLHQYYQNNNLFTDEGDSLMVIKKGYYNTNQGPDFLDASVRINDVLLAGNIEIHINSSDWKLHQHQTDANYNNIILHIVWINDTEITNLNGQYIPQLTISNLVPKWLLDRYLQLMNAPDDLPCSAFLPYIKSIIWTSWKVRLTIERMEEKTNKILALYKESNNHWEEVLWWMIAYNFGLKLNADVFLQVAKSIPVNILGKHKNQLFQIEALLMGQSNLFQENKNIINDEYYLNLFREHEYLSKKYGLQPIAIKPVFLRMRPPGFPTIRIAQLSMLIKQSSHLFSTIKELKDLDKVKEILHVKTSSYWNNHYVFGKESIDREKYTGETLIINIIINTIIPILFAFGKLHKDETIKERMIQWLIQLTPENNAVLTGWVKEGISNDSAFDSQGLLQLSKHYCKQKRCMECAIGNAIITSAKNN